MTRKAFSLFFAAACSGLLVVGCASGPQTGSGGATGSAAGQPPTSQVQRMSRSHVELGEAYLQAGRIGTALEEARVAVALDPAYAPAHLLLASVHALLDETEPARKEFELALKYAPDDPEINNAYGWFLCSSGNEKAGLVQLAKSASNPLYQTPTRPRTNAGLCYLRLKDEASAGREFAAAYALDSSNTLALMNLAGLAYKQGDLVRARVLISEYNQQAAPTAESVWLGLRIERKLANREAEAAYVSRLKSQFGKTQEYQDYLAGRFD